MNKKDGKYHCIYCEDEVLDIMVECGECPNISLCLECFSCGAELGNHKRNHKYRLVQLSALFGYNDGWTTKEDILLLYAILKFGPNWSKIAEKLKKSEDEVKDHYIKHFIESEFAKRIKSDDEVPLLEDYEPTDDDIFIDNSSPVFGKKDKGKLQVDLESEKEKADEESENSNEDEENDMEEEEENETENDDVDITEEEEDDDENVSSDEEGGEEEEASGEDDEIADEDDDSDENISEEDEEESMESDENVESGEE